MEIGRTIKTETKVIGHTIMKRHYSFREVYRYRDNRLDDFLLDISFKICDELFHKICYYHWDERLFDLYRKNMILWR